MTVCIIYNLFVETVLAAVAVAAAPKVRELCCLSSSNI